MRASDREEILRKLEGGQIDVNEALRRLDSPAEDASPLPRPRFWRLGWAICLGSGIGLAVTAAGVATLGGWWWAAAVPAGLVAVLLMALGVLSADAPWLQLHIETRSGGRPRAIRIGFPMPLGPAAWIVRHWPGGSSRLRGTALDELILSLEESLRADQPMVIDVLEGRDGERVRLHLG